MVTSKPEPLAGVMLVAGAPVAVTTSSKLGSKLMCASTPSAWKVLVLSTIDSVKVAPRATWVEAGLRLRFTVLPLVCVGVGVGVNVAVGVLVEVGEPVAVGELVGVDGGVFVGVAVLVGVGEPVGVLVGVGVTAFPTTSTVPCIVGWMLQ